MGILSVHGSPVDLRWSLPVIADMLKHVLNYFIEVVNAEPKGQPELRETWKQVQ